MEIVTRQMLDEFKRDLINELSQFVNSSSQANKLLKNSNLMEYLGCSYSTIENLRNEGILPYKKVMGTYYYLYDEVRKVFEQRVN
jgi:predicted DNA-binding transcriptional regulator AlpA